MLIEVQSSSRILTLDVVRRMSRAQRSTCWSGAPLPAPFAWSVAIDPEALWFVGSLPGGRTLTGDFKRGDFIEGLWNGDVAELFIMDEEGRYQELNISPSGAWWSMTLSSYRQRCTRPQRPVPTLIESDLSDVGWEVCAAFRRDSLEVALTAGSRIHIAGMWYRPEAVYLSSYPPPGTEPDYHRVDCFQAVSVVELRQ